MPSTSIAEELAKKQREIAVSEFFERNKHILGFDSLTKALITSVKEAVDNALDVTEECGILPDIIVDVQRVDKDEYRVAVEDNGPGIVKKEVANIFARLLYGSRFASRRQARGQQGLGISGVILYGQITTGKPARIKTRTQEMEVAYQIELMIDTHKNKPNMIKDDFIAWDKPHGTKVEIFVKGRYIGGKQSIPEYLKTKGYPTAIFTSVSESELSTKASEAGTQLTDHQDGVLHGLLAGTDASESALAKLSQGAADRIMNIVRESFVTGIQTSFKVIAVVALVGFAISVLYVGGRLFGGESKPARETA